MDEKGIKELIQIYFDASFESDGEKIATAFHPIAHVFGHNENGSLNDMDLAAFKKVVDSSMPDKSAPPVPRQDKILAIEFTGENTAVARVELRVGDILFTDILSFIRLNGKWGIICKVFSGVPAR